jgi:hypothetical protein
LAGEGGGANDLESGVLITAASDAETLSVMGRHKEREEKVRQKQMTALNEELKAFMKKLKSLTDKKD